MRKANNDTNSDHNDSNNYYHHHCHKKINLILAPRSSYSNADDAYTINDKKN